ncbi:diacylglycerol kinase [Serratia microhaemolytica]|uniref:diacylglycerol kinase n=1 Tax=Serratia microhaemolytica TaxID=2675110 RepID=UPI000FDE4750|nr:diacylglycerol kinase [Serratia microhaemolytica]
MVNKTKGLMRIVKASGYSYQGLLAAWRYEAAFRQELLMAVLAVLLAFWLDVDSVTRILLIGSVWLVVVVEMINCAIEAVVDRIGTEQHELSGRAKDMGSAAVLLTIVLALVVWVILLWQHWR